MHRLARSAAITCTHRGSSYRGRNVREETKTEFVEIRQALRSETISHTSNYIFSRPMKIESLNHYIVKKTSLLIRLGYGSL